MSAPILNMNVFRKIGSFWSYSRITSVRFLQRRCLQEAVSIPEADYQTDEQGNLIGTNLKRFPEGLDIDPEVEAEFVKDKMHYPKQHPGIMHFKKVPFLPELLKKNARLLLAESDLINNSSFEEDVRHLQQVYLQRQPPVEDTYKREKLQFLVENILADDITSKNINFEELNDTEKNRLLQRANSIANKLFKRNSYGWYQIDYSNHTGLVYLAARLAQNYTILLKIFDEITRRDRDFIPEAILNVGSGVGSATWAADNIWANKIYEYYNVDTSNKMNDFARRLMAKDVKNPLDLTIKGVTFRHNIPSPEHTHNRFPMVVSAYLLMEQPSFSDRLNLISLLWELTDGYLVLVEHGSSAGYRLIMEAREIIMQIGQDHPDQKGHVFAPCTHDMICPKLQLKKLPCTYSIEYRKLNIKQEKGQGDEKDLERYSYLVFKKGPKQDDKRYSRVTKALHKSNHSSCQVCCPDGSLREFVLTKTKQSQALFKCTKKCKEGDFIPFQWPDASHEQKSGIQEQNADIEKQDSCIELKKFVDEETCDFEKYEHGLEQKSSTEEIENEGEDQTNK